MLPVLSRGPSSEFPVLIVYNMSKFADDPGTCRDEGGASSLWDGGVLWAHA